MNKLVSVIIPCYNCANYISRCLDSIISNTYKNLKIICVNDGSVDDTKNILEGYFKKYPFVCVINKDNGGPSSARNIGLSYVKDTEGYITFIDADDYVDSDYIESLVDILESHKVDIVCSNFYFSHGDKKNRCYNLDQDAELSSYEGLIKIFEDKEISSMSHHKLFKASLWNDIRYPEDMFFLEDTATIFKTFLKANKIILSNYCGYYYEQGNNESIMRNKISNKKILSGWKALRYVYEYDYSIYSEKEIKALKQTICNLFMDNFLELYPRYDIKNDKQEVKEYLKFVKDNRLTKRFLPNNKQQKIKRNIYLLFPHLYRFLFRLYVKLR